MAKPIKAAVIGAGMSTTVFHAPLILSLPDLFTLHSVVERNPPETKGGTVGKKFSAGVNVVKSVDELLKDQEIELVVVATPNATHYKFAKAALEAGKHVLIDKPVTTSSEEAKSLQALATSRNLVLYAFQNRRWDSDFLTLQSVIQAGKLGPVWDLESHYDRYRPNLRGGWKDEAGPGSGLIFDLGSHLLDQAVVLFGRPAKLTAFMDNLRGIGNESVSDSFTIILHYPRGPNRSHPITVTLRGHPLSARAPQLRFIARGVEGTFVKYGLDTQEEDLKLSDLSLISSSKFGQEPEKIWGELEVMEGERVVKKTVQSEPGDYRKLYRTLAASIREGAQPAVKWEEAALVILLIELAIQSSKDGKTLDVPAV